jgi:hypothetical protein
MEEAIEGHQWSSVVISGHQWSSELARLMEEVIKGHE